MLLELTGQLPSGFGLKEGPVQGVGVGVGVGDGDAVGVGEGVGVGLDPHGVSSDQGQLCQ